MISLVIKGDMVAAFAAADRQAVELTSVQTTYKSFGSATTYASCDCSMRSRVINWYCRDDGIAPYPAGSLLFYSIKGA
jgi:hypothetical protein